MDMPRQPRPVLAVADKFRRYLSAVQRGPGPSTGAPAYRTSVFNTNHILARGYFPVLECDFSISKDYPIPARKSSLLVSPFVSFRRMCMTTSVSCFPWILSGTLLLALPSAQAGPMQDIGTSSGPQCTGIDVNNSGYVVEPAWNPTARHRASSPRRPAAEWIWRTWSRAAIVRRSPSPMWAGSWVVHEQQFAVHRRGLAATAPTSVQALQALVGGVRSKVTALSQSGAVAGVSLNADNTALPVMWRNNDTTARSLPAGLLGLVATNCVPADIDDHSENPTMPNIVGNCPGSNGRPQPVLWAPDCWASTHPPRCRCLSTPCIAARSRW